MSVTEHTRTSAAPPVPPKDDQSSLAVMFVSLLVVLAIGVALFGVVGMALTWGDDDDKGGPAAAAPVEFDIELGDLYVKPARVEVAAGQAVTLHVTNAGAVAHDLRVGGESGTAMLDPGKSETISVGPFDADAQAWCTVPGHKEAGMLLDIAVSGEVAGGSEASGGTAAAAATGAKIDANAAPAADWKPFDPALKPATGGTEHKISFAATEKVIEVAPGVKQELWTFNDQVPGPVLRGKVGDVFTVTLTNEGKLGHSIDFHASKVAWNDEMRTINPGESLVYQFEAKHAGIFMYHCGTAPTLHHIGNGMYGAIVIDPPDLAPVAKEYVLVQSELYLGPDGKPGDLTKMQNDDWDAVVFNGYHAQYKHSPIRVEPNERVRVWVLDAGPSENSAFHIVGTVFDTVFKEGAYTLRPGAGRGGAQVLDLQPASGGFVEFTFDEAGLYPIVTHKFSNPGKGALGLFQAGEVAPAAAGASH